jgi:hypothetical protein
MAAMSRSKKSKTDSKQTELDFGSVPLVNPPQQDQKPPAEESSIPGSASVEETRESGTTAPQHNSAGPPYRLPNNLGIGGLDGWLKTLLSSNKKEKES